MVRSLCGWTVDGWSTDSETSVVLTVVKISPDVVVSAVAYKPEVYCCTCRICPLAGIIKSVNMFKNRTDKYLITLKVGYS